jgi:hypothetical protein
MTNYEKRAQNIQNNDSQKTKKQKLKQENNSIKELKLKISDIRLCLNYCQNV